MACFASGRSAGLERNHALKLAIAVEYFHTASLIFDDLPCMDDADTRRHAPCVHRTHGESAAVLAGLALITRAYSLIGEGIAFASLPDHLKATSYIDQALGVFSLLGGQSRDLHDSRSSRSPHGVLAIARMKTVPLLRLAALLPVIITGGSPRLIQLLERYCLFVGLAFQIADDLKDFVGPVDTSGKTGGRDLALGRPNLVLAGGAQSALQLIERLNRLGDKTVSQLPGSPAQWRFLDRLRTAVPAMQPRETPHLTSVAS